MLAPRRIQSRGFSKPPERVRMRDLPPGTITAARTLHSASMSGGVSGRAVEKTAPIRDESYRRLVASLPCYQCRIVGYSQAAHPNTGKAKGMKLSDLECFPLCCTRPGIVGCHVEFDNYRLVKRADMPAYERAAAAWTKEQLKGQP